MSYDLESNEETLGTVPDLAAIKRNSSHIAPSTSSVDEAVTRASVSVIIPTYTMDRWDYLCECIASAQAQTVQTQEIIVVVDHNPELYARAMRELSGVIVVPNISRQGVSGARNSGVKASCGELIAFLDDDVVASPDWLASLLRHFKNPEVAGAGCHSEGLWESPRPAWVPGEFGWTIGVSYSGMPNTPTAVRNVWTSAMVVKRTSFEMVDGFREDFGKVGNRNLPEDTDLCLRITSAHDKAIWIYDPSTVMLHRVPAGRTTFGYLLSRCFLQGWGKAAMASMDGFSTSTSMERDYTRRILPAGIGRGFAETIRGDIFGAVRSVSIIVALAFTMAGYLWYLLESRRAMHAMGSARGSRSMKKWWLPRA